jgi:hypothetical protein
MPVRPGSRNSRTGRTSRPHASGSVVSCSSPRSSGR